MRSGARKILTVGWLSVGMLFLPVGPALATYCDGENCGASRGPQWHCHFVAGDTGQQCWDEGDDTCESQAGHTFGSACPFSGAEAAGVASISSAVQVTNELFTQFVAPATPPSVARTLRESGGISPGAGAKPPVAGTQEKSGQGRIYNVISEFSGVLSYEGYQYVGTEGSLYGIRLGYDSDHEAFGWEVRVPFQYMSFEGDVTGYRIGGEGQFKGHLINGPVAAWNLGLAALFNGLKIEDVDFDYVYGGGPFTSLDLSLGPVGLTIGGGGTYVRPKEGDGTITFMAGGSAGVPLMDILSVSLHGYHSMLYDQEFNEIKLGNFPDLSNSFSTVGFELGLAVTKSWMLTGGYNRRFGYGDYTANEGYLGASTVF